MTFVNPYADAHWHRARRTLRAAKGEWVSHQDIAAVVAPDRTGDHAIDAVRHAVSQYRNRLPPSQRIDIMKGIGYRLVSADHPPKPPRVFSNVWPPARIDAMMEMVAEGLPTAEIAKRLGSTPETVRVKIFHARKALRSGGSSEISRKS